MTASVLIAKLNNTYGMDGWPSTYEVNAETYGYCCQAIFNQSSRIVMITGRAPINIHIGKNCGLMFKNVELILKT